MNEKTLNTLNYYDVKDIIKSYCVSELGKKLIDEITPTNNISQVKHSLQETTEARTLIDNSYSIPLKGIANISLIIEKLEKEAILEIDDLNKVADFLNGCKAIKKFFENKETYAKNLTSYCANITLMPEIVEEINNSIKGNSINSEATKELKKIRRHIDICEGKIKEKLDKFIKNSVNKAFIQDPIIVQRNGKYTIPIISNYKNKVEGTIVDYSQRGTTLYLEPATIQKHSAELEILFVEEQVEIYKILSEISNQIYENLYFLTLNIDIISKYDMIFAKGKFSANTRGISPKLNYAGRINIINGIHPLISDFQSLNFSIADTYRSLVITGPNAGGKTIVLKTVGLLTLMTMSGFHISASKNTEISLFQNIFVDIGDNQSIENSLSTFSSHMQNLSYILQKTNHHTLTLLDEIGSGTEPNEGAGLGIAILEELYKKGAIILATTHYGEIKSFSEQHEGFENAAMEYRDKTLEPLYKLRIGKSGDSNAFYIAQKMGIPEHIRAKALSYIETKNYDLSLIDNSKITKYADFTEDEVKSSYTYAIGDRVKLLDNDKIGLVYKPINSINQVEIFVENEIVSVHEKRLQLLAEATNLYPHDYDLNNLFTSFKERKLEHDIERGSKKGIKKLFKETT